MDNLSGIQSLIIPVHKSDADDWLLGIKDWHYLVANPCHSSSVPRAGYISAWGFGKHQYSQLLRYFRIYSDCEYFCGFCHSDFVNEFLSRRFGNSLVKHFVRENGYAYSFPAKIVKELLPVPH